MDGGYGLSYFRPFCEFVTSNTALRPKKLATLAQLNIQCMLAFAILVRSTDLW